MTILLETQSFRNSRNTSTIRVSRYQEKFYSASFWRVTIQRDGNSLSYTVKDCLRRKPTKAQIKTYCETL